MKPTNTILKIVTLCVICAAIVMSGCVVSDGEWELDGTLKHIDDEIVMAPNSTPTPEIVYIIQTPEPTSAPTSVVTATVGIKPTPYKGTPKLEIYRECPVSVMAGEKYEVSLRLVNSGDGEAVDIELNEPSIDKTYKNGCPSTVDDMSPGESVYIYYEMIIDEDADSGVYYLDPTVLNYMGDEGNSYSTQSGSDAVVIVVPIVPTPEPTAEPTPDPTPVPTIEPTPAPTVEPTPDPVPSTSAVINIDDPIYSGVVRNNGEILDIRITPDPLISGKGLRIEIDVLNTGTVTTWFELEWEGRDPEEYIYAGDMETFVFSTTLGDPGDRNWEFELYWDATWPASNVLLQTATVNAHCYTQYEVDNM